MRWLIIVFILWVPALAQAQVNVERLRSDQQEDGLSGSLGLNAAFTSGNILFADFGTASHLEWRKNKDLIFWVLNARYAAKRTQADLLAEPDIDLWDEEAHFANLMLQHLRYNRQLSDAWWWEAFTQFEYNEFLLLDRRLIAGTGPRWALANGKKGGIWMGTSAMVEEERLNPDSIAPTESVQTVVLRSSSYLTTTLRGEQWSLVTTLYMQPQFADFGDYRMMGESSLTLKMNKTLSFTVDARIRHDTHPPITPAGAAEVQSTDTSIKNGIKISW